MNQLHKERLDLEDTVVSLYCTAVVNVYMIM